MLLDISFKTMLKDKGSYLILQDLLTNRISGRYFEVH